MLRGPRRHGRDDAEHGPRGPLEGSTRSKHWYPRVPLWWSYRFYELSFDSSGGTKGQKLRFFLCYARSHTKIKRRGVTSHRQRNADGPVAYASVILFRTVVVVLSYVLGWIRFVACYFLVTTLIFEAP